MGRIFDRQIVKRCKNTSVWQQKDGQLQYHWMWLAFITDSLTAVLRKSQRNPVKIKTVFQKYIQLLNSPTKQFSYVIQFAGGFLNVLWYILCVKLQSIINAKDLTNLLLLLAKAVKFA